MKKSDYSFVLLSALFITTSAFAEGPMFAAVPETATTSGTTTNPVSNLFSASPAATISPVTTPTPFATTTSVTTTSPITTTAGSMFAASPTTPATAGHAFEVSIFGIGPAVDVAASSTVRQVIGHAVASGVIDRFIVLGSGVGGGFLACAEAAPTGQVVNFNAVINQLNTIQPNPQTTAYSVTPVESCSTETVFCTQDVQQCPDGSFVGRVPPSCTFAACPVIR